MRVTVLGSAASHAGEGQACAGHLVEGGGVRVLFDCGNGVLANLYKVIDPLSIDAVFITHNHPDHYVDLYSMQSMLQYSPKGPIGSLPLFLPDGLFERLQGLLSERGAEAFRAAFDAKSLVDGQPVSVGGMTVTPKEVEHTPPTYALVADADGARLVFTADTAPCDHACTAVEGADFILAEATLPEQYAGQSPHMTAREAGELAKDAGAIDLALVHVWPTNDRDQAKIDAEKAFGGPVTVAREFDSFEVRPRGNS